MAMDEKGLGRRVQAVRTEAGLTQQALCQHAGLSYSTLTKIERGAIRSPSIFTIQRIAEALTVSLDELLGLDASAKPVRKVKHRSKSGVSFVYFDINGCLVRFYHRAFTRLAEQSGMPVDVIETAYWHYNDDVCRGDITLEQFNRLFAEAAGVEQLNWLDNYLAAIEPIEEMQELVRWAADRYRIGLLTNIMPGFVETMKRQNVLPNVMYDAIVDSSAVKAMKPEERIYEVAAEQAHCSPAEILLIDDTHTNLMAAQKKGWHVLWFDDYQPEESIARIKSALEPAD